MSKEDNGHGALGSAGHNLLRFAANDAARAERCGKVRTVSLRPAGAAHGFVPGQVEQAGSEVLGDAG